MKKAKSKLEESIDKALKAIWPRFPVVHEFPIKIGRTTLYVDRVLPQFKLAIEADGIQHGTFSHFFHKDHDGFQDSLKRDRMKQEWLEENDYTVIRFAHDEEVTPVIVRTRILKALADGKDET